MENDVLIGWYNKLPYAYKFVQDFIFMNFTNQQVFSKLKMSLSA